MAHLRLECYSSICGSASRLEGLVTRGRHETSAYRVRIRRADTTSSSREIKHEAVESGGTKMRELEGLPLVRCKGTAATTAVGRVLFSGQRRQCIHDIRTVSLVHTPTTAVLNALRWGEWTEGRCIYIYHHTRYTFISGNSSAFRQLLLLECEPYQVLRTLQQAVRYSCCMPRLLYNRTTS